MRRPIHGTRAFAGILASGAVVLVVVALVLWSVLDVGPTRPAPVLPTVPAVLPTAEIRALGAADLPPLPVGPTSVVLAIAHVEPGAQWTPAAGATVLLAGVLDGQVTVDGKAVAAGTIETVAAGAEIAAAEAGPAAVVLAAVGVAEPPVGGTGTIVQPVASIVLDAPPPGPVRVELARLVLGPAAIAPPRTEEGPVLVAVETGVIDIALHPGAARVRRATGGEELVSGGPGDPLAPFAAPDGDGHGEDIGAGAGQPQVPGHGEVGGGLSAATRLQGGVVGLGAGDAAALSPGTTRTMQGVAEDPSVAWLVLLGPAGTAGTPTASPPP